MNQIKIPSELQKVNEIFSQNGFKAYLVGGAVRDTVLGKGINDWDIATDATPEQVMKMFRKVIPTGIAHGTVTIHIFGHEIEATTFRTEADYSDGRHPDSVSYAATIEEDLSRRDFTMNAIAADLADGHLVDPFDGQKDIAAKIIRTVGNAFERFNEDGLRPVRAIRFASQLGFSIEKNTLETISKPEILARTKMISVERFRDELVKLLKSDRPSDGIKLLESTGILKIFMPQFEICRGCIQKDDRAYHIFDVMDHLVYACDGAPKEKPLVRLAALLHDIGKPASKTVVHEDGLEIFHFFGHDKTSASIAKQLLVSLKFSNAEIDHICSLIQNHMFNYQSDWSDAAVRRFIVKAGLENIEDLIDLRLADMYGKYNEPVRIHDSAACDLLIELEERIKAVTAEASALSLKDLAVNGKDLMANGIPGGKALGFILNELLETVLDSPEMNQKEKLLSLAMNIYSEKFSC